MMNPMRAFAGIAAAIVPLGLTIFALAMLVITSWRTWFGLQRKRKPKDKKDDK